MTTTSDILTTGAGETDGTTPVVPSRIDGVRQILTDDRLDRLGLPSEHRH